MEVQSGWKWNEWRKALSVLTILHEERRKREGKERELSYMEVLSHGDASGIQHSLPYIKLNTSKSILLANKGSAMNKLSVNKYTNGSIDR
jgi:hypothetical protein